MSLYRPKGSAVWVYDFSFAGTRIRGSTKQTAKTLARQVYERRKQELRDGASGIRRQQKPELVSKALKDWVESKQLHWSKSMQSIASYAVQHLTPVLGNRLLMEIEATDIRRYQRHRIEERASGRTVNIEVGLLRQAMRRRGCWSRIAADVKMLPERQDVGRALTDREESMLLLECGRSASRSLLPFILMLMETGARLNTIRTLTWEQIDFSDRYLRIGKDKTRSGTGRRIPLSTRAIDTLTLWAQHFPERKANHFVFPSEKYGLHGQKGTFGGEVRVYKYDPMRPMGSINSAWQSAKRRTQRHCPECKTGMLANREKPDTGYICVDCNFIAEELPQGLARLRLHDLRHTFCSRCISAKVPIPIIAKMVGWSAGTMAAMAGRYGHFSMDDMREALDAINRGGKSPQISDPPQIPPQSNAVPTEIIN